MKREDSKIIIERIYLIKKKGTSIIAKRKRESGVEMGFQPIAPLF